MIRRIIHVIDSLGVGGAQSMLFELYSSIEHYFPDFEQIVMLLYKNRLNKEFVESYKVPYYPIKSYMMNHTLLAYQESIILFYHKLIQSRRPVFANGLVPGPNSYPLEHRVYL